MRAVAVLAALASAAAALEGCWWSSIPIRAPTAAASAARAGARPPGLLDDLVGYWRLDDGAGSAIARDCSGHGNDGKLVGLAPGPPGRRGTRRGRWRSKRRAS